MSREGEGGRRRQEEERRRGYTLFLCPTDLARPGARATGKGPVMLAVSRAAVAAARMTLGWLEALASRRVGPITEAACSITWVAQRRVKDG